MSSKPSPPSPPWPRSSPPSKPEAWPVPPARPPRHPRGRKRELTPEERVVESAKRKGRRHAQDARGEAAIAVAIAAVAQQEDTNARVKATLLCLGVNPNQQGLVNAAIVAAAVNTGSSTYPRMMMPESPRASCTQPIPGFRVYTQGNRFSEECSPEVSIVAPSTPASGIIDLNVAPVAGGSSSGGTRKRRREMPADMLTNARNLFDGMPVAVDDDTTNHFLEKMIFEDGEPATGAYDPDETQSQDGRAPFTQATNDCDNIQVPPYQMQNKRGWVSLSKRWRVIQQDCNKFCATYESIKERPVSGLGMQDMVFQALEAFKVQHDGKAFHLAHCWTIINGEEKFKAQYASLLARGQK
ncbi:Lectin-domain containing receptor kinase A4.3 [Hordeum vulgare]|nr:Lectin-domain containing receptor kinase A4.3 [Hordeum vulgare]